jgi:hypothetical protein
LHVYHRFFLLAFSILLICIHWRRSNGRYYSRETPYSIFSTGCSIYRATAYTTHETFDAQNYETDVFIEFLQIYAVVAADTLLEIGTAVISAVLFALWALVASLPASRNAGTSRSTVVLFDTLLSGYALLNASRAAADDFVAK